MNNNGISSVIGAVFMVGLVTVCASILYIVVIPEIQNYASMLKLTPRVIGICENGNLRLIMTEGLPTGSWTLNVDGAQVSNGTGFCVGNDILKDIPNGTHIISLIEGDSYPRLIYYNAKLNSNGSNPEPPDNTITCYQCQNDTSIQHIFNGTQCPEGWYDTEQDCASPVELYNFTNASDFTEDFYGSVGYTPIDGGCIQHSGFIEFYDNDDNWWYWAVPINVTGNFSVEMLCKENPVSGSSAVGLMVDGIQHETSHCAYTLDVQTLNFRYWDAEIVKYLSPPVPQSFNTRLWKIDVHTINHTYDVQVYENGVLLGSGHSDNYGYNSGNLPPKCIAIQTVLTNHANLYVYYISVKRL